MNTAWLMLLLTLVVCQSVSAFAQESSPSPAIYKEWFVVGLGAGPPQDVHSVISYSFGRRRFFQVAFHHNEAFTLGNRGRAMTSAAISVGARAAVTHAFAAYFIGPALVSAWAPAHDTRPGRRFTGGLVINPQLYVRPFADLGTPGGIPLKGLGFGLDLYGNLNPIRSTVGVRLGLYMGTTR